MMCSKLHCRLAILRRVKPFIPRDSITRLADSLVNTHLDFCSPLLCNFSGNQLESLLKLCTRTIFSVNKRTHSKPLIIGQGLPPIYQRIEYLSCVLMFEMDSKTAPPYLVDMFRKLSEVHSHCT